MILKWNQTRCLSRWKQMEINKKVYLGDAVYVHCDGFMFWLTTTNGIEQTNEIALEPEVAEGFFRFVLTFADNPEELLKKLGAK